MKKNKFRYALMAFIYLSIYLFIHHPSGPKSTVKGHLTHGLGIYALHKYIHVQFINRYSLLVYFKPGPMDYR